MEKIIVFFMIALFSINSYAVTIGPVTVKLRNGQEIVGQLVSFKNYRLYVSKDDILYIIDGIVVSDLIYKSQKIDLNKLSRIKFDRLLWSDYSKQIKINRDNLLSFSLGKNIIDFDIKPDNTLFVNNQSKYYIFKAGKSLKEYSKLTYLGYGLSLVGLIVTLTNKDKSAKTIGPLISLSGFIIFMIAPSEVNKAGVYLQKSIENNSINDD